jgi:hypothetical protein
LGLGGVAKPTRGSLQRFGCDRIYAVRAITANPNLRDLQYRADHAGANALSFLAFALGGKPRRSEMIERAAVRLT